MDFTASNRAQASSITSDQLQSMTIDLLRFPLALMVIFIHIMPGTSALSEANFPIISGRGIYNIIAIMISHGIGYIAVPAFFLISGYLFFINGSDMTWNFYRYKIKRRLHSLIIPYFLWNALSVLLTIVILTPPHDITNLLSGGYHLFWDCKVWGGYPRINWLGDAVYSTGPLDPPLWFLRDLIVVSLISPILYVVINRLKIYGILIWLILYVSNVWITVPGLSITAIFYFSLGAYLAINRYNIVTLVHRYKYVTLPVTILLYFIVCYYDGNNTSIGFNIVPFYCICGTFSIFYIASELIMKYRCKPNKLLVSSCFFVYALHNIIVGYNPVAISKKTIHFLIPELYGFEVGICYFLTPVLTAAICVAIYVVCRKLFPKVTLILSGNK